MLRSREDMYCGVFDSSIVRQNKNKSPVRTVVQYEIELFHSQGGISHVNGKSYPSRRGMILCARPGDLRYSDFPVRCSFIRIMPRDEADECERIINSLPQIFYIDDNAKENELLALFGKLGSTFAGTREGDADVETLRINSLLFEILCRITKICQGYADDNERMGTSKIVREAYEYINENFCSDCSLGRIASAVHISPNYLHTVFCEQIGMTPFEYVTEKRIEKAKKLIACGEYSMLEIALETGFCSQSHFNKVFKTKCGITPAQYKKGITYEY